MKRFILIVVASVLLNFTNGVEFDEVDVYDDFEEKERSEDVADEIEPVRPNYDLKDAGQMFLAFITQYNKQYKTEEDYNQHYANFVNNLKEIIAHNKAGGSVSDINMFADYSDEELAKHG